MKNFIAGQWIDKAKKIEVAQSVRRFDHRHGAESRCRRSGESFGLRRARRKVMAKLSSYERWKILRKAADLLAARNEDLGQTISRKKEK